MKISFACPSCNASGTVDAVHIGRQVRCKRCGARFAIPDPEASQPDVYALEEPSPGSMQDTSKRPAEDAVFVPARADAMTTIERPRRRERSTSGSNTRSDRTSNSDIPSRTWLFWWAGALVLVLTAIALLAPGNLAGGVYPRWAFGSILVPVAYFAGAYGAFSEDSLYGHSIS